MTIFHDGRQRDNSTDSRYLGFLNRNFIKAKASSSISLWTTRPRCGNCRSRSGGTGSESLSKLGRDSEEVTVSLHTHDKKSLFPSTIGSANDAGAGITVQGLYSFNDRGTSAPFVLAMISASRSSTIFPSTSIVSSGCREC